MGLSSPPALPPGVDVRALARYLRSAHDEFVDTGALDRRLRPLVADSWRRSMAGGLDPESSLAPIALDDDRLAAVRAGHPLAAAMPVIRRLLVEAATEAGLLVAVSDAAGRLLWVEGAARLRGLAESMHFLPGADWSETRAGTNAPGTALALDQPVQILGAEHLARPVTPWSCAAAPIHSPDTGAVLGVLDLTGGSEVVTAQTLMLVRATVAAVEAELRLTALPAEPVETARVLPVGGWAARGGAPTPKPEPGREPVGVRHRLELLGRRGARVLGPGTSRTLTLRHSEILLLLLAAGETGLNAGELAVALSSEDHPAVTARAELSRLRTLLGELRLGSRPYRVLDPVQTDVDDVRAHLAAGRLRQAVAGYPGPVLPSSAAPAVEELRASLHDQLRAAVIADADPDALLAFADTPHGRDDYPVWAAALAALPAGSPRHAQVAAHVRRLDARLG